MSLRNIPTGTAEYLSVAAGAASGIAAGAYTFGILYRRPSPFDHNSPLWFGYQANDFQYRGALIDAGDLYAVGSGYADANLGIGAWYWLIVTKPSAVGTTVRFHWASYASSGALTWSHVDGGTTYGTQSDHAAVARFTLGDPFGSSFWGDFAVIAGWTRELSDVEVEAAFTQQAQDAYAANPGLLVLAPEATAGTALTDTMGGTGELARTANWIPSTDPPGFNFSAGNVPTTGTAASSVTVVSSATGLREPVALGSGTVTVDASGTGTQVAGGSATGQVLLTGSGTGAAARRGQATGVVLIHGATVGRSADSRDITILAATEPRTRTVASHPASRLDATRPGSRWAGTAPER